MRFRALFAYTSTRKPISRAHFVHEIHTLPTPFSRTAYPPRKRAMVFYSIVAPFVARANTALPNIFSEAEEAVAHFLRHMPAAPGRVKHFSITTTGCRVVKLISRLRTAISAAKVDRRLSLPHTHPDLCQRHTFRRVSLNPAGCVAVRFRGERALMCDTRILRSHFTLLCIVM